jgi:hypothetical protein
VHKQLAALSPDHSQLEVEHFNGVELRIAIDANMPIQEAEKLLARISPPYAYRTSIKIPYPHSLRTLVNGP